MYDINAINSLQICEEHENLSSKLNWICVFRSVQDFRYARHRQRRTVESSGISHPSPDYQN